ncbi:MAG: M23 family metallopeptidase [Chlorobi bacterium]|nr:M23 family metallopeptidase [Chlorobiota bacterium]
MKYYIFLILTLFFFNNFLAAQDNSKKEDFRSPIDFPILLSASFGELRAGHFHAGIDIKTKGTEGKKIHAVGDGYISRIKISINGYGNALYINHPNGYTSVYGHLKEFSIHIAEFLKKYQYKNETFTADIILKQDEIKVKKGEVIALSGNSGGSLGPHLHFEIRDTKTQEPINPLLLGFLITDNISPKIYSVTIYPLNFNSYINNKYQKLILPVKGTKGNYYIATEDSIFVSGLIGFGIRAHDFHNYTHNKCGIYKLKLGVDDSVIYSHTIDRFSFSKTSYINSHLDYEEFIKENVKMHKCYVEPNNNLGIYDVIKNRGITKFNDNQKHKIQFKLTDEYGNQSKLSFPVYAKINGNKNRDLRLQDSSIIVMPYDTINIFENHDIKLKFPAYTFYDTLFFQFSEFDSSEISNYKIFSINSKYVPTNKKYSIKINSQFVPDSLLNKTVIAKLSGNKNKFTTLNTTHKDGYLTCKTKAFGLYTLVIDTVAPTIKNITKEKEWFTLNDKIEFTAIDLLTGIKSYTGTINDNWVLFEYDKKKNHFWYTFDEYIKYDSIINLKFVVKDYVGNESVVEKQYYYRYE